MKGGLATELKTAERREEDALRRRDYRAATEAREQVRRLREAIQSALRPNSVRARDEVRNDLPTPSSYVWYRRQRAYERLRESA